MIMKKQIILYAALLLLLVSNVSALLSCDYNSEPIIEADLLNREKIRWTCTETSSTAYNCLTYVRNGTDYFQTNPLPTFNEKTGETIESFSTTNGIINVHFRGLDLIHNRTAVFGVTCSTGNSFEANVTPMLRGFDDAFNVVEFTVRDGVFILFAVLFIIIIILVFRYAMTNISQ